MHLWNVVWSRLCLASRPQARRTIPSLRWTWSLWSVRERLYLKRPDLARFNDLLMSGTALINYMFSTMLLSGMQLIHAEAALRIACVFCVMAVIASAYDYLDFRSTSAGRTPLGSIPIGG